MANSAEAYESDSDGESVASTSRAGVAASGGTQARNEGALDDEDDEGGQEIAAGRRGEEIDWATVTPRIRDAMVDPSRKRREAFINRYLIVSPESKLWLALVTDVRSTIQPGASCHLGHPQCTTVDYGSIADRQPRRRVDGTCQAGREARRKREAQPR
jgi:hypothetical protein